MNDQIICPHCKKTIPLTQALSHQIKEKLKEESKEEIEQEKRKLNAEAMKWKEEQMKKIANKIKSETDFKLKDVQNESEELKKRYKQIQDQLLESNRVMRKIKMEDEQRKIEMEKKIASAEEKIREEEKKKMDNDYRFKFLEYEKKIKDISLVNEDLKRKLEQGSQQLQGEVLELELETVLKREFPLDEIKPVPKGTMGADLLQIVKSDFGRNCGTIIWEMKRTKSWSEGWISKLKEDQRQVKAEIAIIISQSLPNDIRHFAEKNGVLIGSFETIVSLGSLVRQKLIELTRIKMSFVGKQGKKELLWNYLTSTEFQQRLEALREAVDRREEILRKERDWFRKKWSLEEKSIQILKDNLLGMHSDLQAIVGKMLPEMKGLEMLTQDERDKDTLF